VKETDETPLGENESEVERVIAANAVYALTRMDELEKRIMKLEQRKVANENNQKDPEWY